MKITTKDYPQQYEVLRHLDNKVEVIVFDISSVKEIQVETESGSETQYIVDGYKIVVLENSDYSSLLELARNREIEELSKEIRQKRDELLNKTDWTQCVDNALSEEEKAKYKVYRQKLRDITKQESFPYNVVFPEV